MRRGQTLLEYTIILGIIALVISGMGPYIKLGIQSLIKTTADQLALQNEADQDVEDVTDDYLEYSFATTRAHLETLQEETYNQKAYYFGDRTRTVEEQVTNYGYTSTE